MVEDIVKDLLQAGVHFGHQTKRWNPKMKKFIFGARAGIYIIDLEKTAECLKEARTILKDVSAQGGKILFVGTKKQAQESVNEVSEKTGMYYVSNRWSGGLLTNFETVKKSISRLNDIERMKDDGVWDNLKKKEVARLNKEKDKLLFNFGGIREMRKMPDAIFIIDPKKEDIAVREATKLKIPIVAIVDTNCDPELVDYPVPGNDDALKSIRFICDYLGEGVLEGKKEFFLAEAAQEKAKEDAKKEAEEAAKVKQEATAVEAKKEEPAKAKDTTKSKDAGSSTSQAENKK